MSRTAMGNDVAAEVIVEQERDLQAAEIYSERLADERSARVAAEAVAAVHKEELEKERRLRSVLEHQLGAMQGTLEELKAMAARPVVPAPELPSIPSTEIDGWDVSVVGRTDLGDIKELKIRPFQKGA